ncbi:MULTISPECIES: Phenylacetic acid catabolic protein [Alcaligenaceae]|jgi:ring-1,2-phenylacetyl-CoA epoxidase subunit PaaA|uniref:Phenylacetic acid catabolic n=1 Tax=Neopusillimonas maritima TaxID=2026239 RepID=A0ABX9MW90_9BURK|nr:MULTISPECIES: Phenylacetic acid catabolic protein [Alcaligenaceae]QIM47925.1 hypothetical protein G9Q38_01375 [Pusillimonas sp. DMV24BSW_D]RII83225.1 hypothetical protein CJO09_06350 [Neopusillimonas maritima]
MQNVAEKLEAGSVSLQDFRQQDPEFQELMLNIISIHVASEMYGADCFEPSILKAPTAEFKMRMAKTVMEEYGHHLRFRQLMEELDLDWEEYARRKGHLTTFDTPVDTWADQVVFLALVDRAAAHQFRHFVNSPYQPFQKACQETLKEEYGHVGLGMDGVKHLLQTEEGRAQVEAAVKIWLPVGLQSFGGDGSKRNEAYRRWCIKQDTNENMRLAYFQQVRNIITQDWGIDIPEDMNEVWRSDGDDTERAY